ncbi:flavin-containing monooxygenase [Nocardioides marmoribigeumensis]|uniref:Cation diffusion facilitator CzcD-associated flavoprotein CzcO n=1 Tax=Nocardioides marmoribigeumensis TaxID=433649 RepID=A0ABU2BT72_9ACTN|nr:NAD(P)/FAD-dependent oxidoreductase [Nocardioides marmoribigeumensis]MDR7361199.1 cation diffusion facilitator CzcD-associated flavoprotein CzcO [Nocardioides marmoribigeumensis]
MARRTAERLDLVVVGAGLSGIGAAHHFSTAFPDRSYAVLEGRGAMGGTWDLFRYPGVRSDSDMVTLGYSFRPWTDPTTMAGGDAIRDYIRDTAREGGIDGHVRYHHRVLAADWSSEDGEWRLTVERGAPDEEPVTEEIRASFLMGCTGYYRYDQGYTPELPGQDDFRGQLVHPQHWPEDLDYTGKRVVVIGSGATAITLVPALTDRAEHVTMLQRTPTYITSLPAEDPFFTSRLGRALPEGLRYRVARTKNVVLQSFFYQLARRRPDTVRAMLRKATMRQVPDVDVDTHFNPPYNPWDQRLCVVPGGDLFRALRKEKASVVTDRIARLDATGILLESGEHLEADIVVTATGLNLLAFGGIDVRVDGKPVDLPQTMVYRGAMLSGVPNFAFVVGYTNASWTLKADLVCGYVMRLLGHMQRAGQAVVTPTREPDVEEAPFLDFASGYVQRSVADFPRQGSREPWKLRQNYFYDAWKLGRASFEDSALSFSNPSHEPDPESSLTR